jgi:hypothetical protein
MRRRPYRLAAGTRKEVADMNAEMTATLVAVLAPLVGVPMSVITFYLRAIREGQVGRGVEMARRIESLEQQTRALEQLVEDQSRDYTTKEEWLRETMLARQQLQRLTEMVARIQARLDLAPLPGAPMLCRQSHVMEHGEDSGTGV